MTWVEAKAWTESLVYYDPVRNTHWGDWRLPRVGRIDGAALKQDFALDGSSEMGYNIRTLNNEIPHLYYVTLGNTATHPPIADPGPFLNTPTTWVFGQWYWTETVYPYSISPSAYYFDFIAGMQNVSDHTNQHYAWVLRDGDVGLVPEQSTFALLLLGVFLLGAGSVYLRFANRRDA